MAFGAGAGLGAGVRAAAAAAFGAGASLGAGFRAASAAVFCAADSAGVGPASTAEWSFSSRSPSSAQACSIAAASSAAVCLPGAAAGAGTSTAAVTAGTTVFSTPPMSTAFWIRSAVRGSPRAGPSRIVRSFQTRGAVGPVSTAAATKARSFPSTSAWCSLGRSTARGPSSTATNGLVSAPTSS